ncbi:unnamed protein product, partial [marine sediment metagenome]
MVSPVDIWMGGLGNFVADEDDYWETTNVGIVDAETGDYLQEPGEQIDPEVDPDAGAVTNVYIKAFSTGGTVKTTRAPVDADDVLRLADLTAIPGDLILDEDQRIV